MQRLGATPTSKFNPQYIEASEIEIAVDSFTNHGTEIRVPLKRLYARERCGISLAASGVFAMDSTQMNAQEFRILTPASRIGFDATMGLDSINPPLKVVLNASVSPDDLKKLLPEAAAPIAATLPPYYPVDNRSQC